MYSITLPPREPGTSDAEWVQHEIDSHESETVFELVGEFDFANETVTVTRGLTLHGVAIEESEEPTTIIIGGGERYDNVDDPEDPLIGANVGAFRVISDGPVVFQDLLFRRWIGEAVLVQACDGLTVKRCYFTEPVPGSLGQRLGSLTFANAVLANGGFCKGDLIFESNCGRFSYSGDMPNDEGLLACLDTNFSSMQASHNDLTGHDEGLEIIRNGWGLENFDIPIILRDDTFTLLESLPIGWPGHAACMCLNNHNARTEIVDNSITLRGEGTAFALSGEHFEVRDNDLTLESRWRVLNRRGPMMREYPTAFQLGTDLQPEVLATFVRRWPTHG